MRTAGSDGRTGGSPPAPLNPSKRRPGTGRVCLRGAVSRSRRPGARPPRAPARSARGRPGSSRGGGTRIGSPITTRTCARRGSHVPGRSPSAAPTIATGTSGAPVASAMRAAPRCHGRSGDPSTVPWGKKTTLSPAAIACAAAATAADVAPPALDLDRAEGVHQPTRPHGSPRAPPWRGTAAGGRSRRRRRTDRRASRGWRPRSPRPGAGGRSPRRGGARRRAGAAGRSARRSR